MASHRRTDDNDNDDDDRPPPLVTFSPSSTGSTPLLPPSHPSLTPNWPLDENEDLEREVEVEEHVSPGLSFESDEWQFVDSNPFRAYRWVLMSSKITLPFHPDVEGRIQLKCEGIFDTYEEASALEDELTHLQLFDPFHETTSFHTKIAKVAK